MISFVAIDQFVASNYGIKNKHVYDFFRRYFFLSLSMVVVLGMLNGLVLLPVLLSLVGPHSEVKCISGFVCKIFQTVAIQVT